LAKARKFNIRVFEIRDNAITQARGALRRNVRIFPMAISFKSLCIYCGSSPGARPEYAEAAYATGMALATRGIALVYGGGRAGLMGAVAQGALEGGGRVTGIIPQALWERELGHDGLSELVVVPDMHSRKFQMAERADGFIALPGGWGTMEELTEMLTWLQLDFHRKPIGILNVAGYFDHLFAFVEAMIAAQFVREEHQRLFCVGTEPLALLDLLAAFTLPKPVLWSERAPLTPHQRELGVK
jgi:uncharacterized protein (TIGR00730 family)